MWVAPSIEVVFFSTRKRVGELWKKGVRLSVVREEDLAVISAISSAKAFPLE
jgi:archaeosine-15-forming tRNA-guanine transglycosylase